MAEPRDELLEHEYDGIREYNNPLPAWWLWLFYGTIAFSVAYIPYTLLGFAPTSGEMYESEMAAALAQRTAPGASTTPAPPAAPGVPGAPAAPAALSGAPAAGGGASLAGNPEAIAAGRAIYLANCLPCHADKAQGLIGPNLTDNYWLHGNTYEDIVNTITNGVPDKGMIPWKAILNPEKIGQVAAFVKSLKGSNPPNPKAPQGKEYPD